MSNNKTFEITLQLAEIEHLFQKPDISPLSKGYHVYSYISGIEYLSNELYADPSYNAVRLSLQLPPDQITAKLEAQTKAAVARYCQGRLRDVWHEIHALRWRGTRTLAQGVVALFILIGASRLVYSDENLLRQVISEGLSIGAWVSLWVPLDTLIFKIWEHRLDQKIYSLLSEMEISLSPIE